MRYFVQSNHGRVSDLFGDGVHQDWRDRGLGFDRHAWGGALFGVRRWIGGGLKCTATDISESNVGNIRGLSNVKLFRREGNRVETEVFATLQSWLMHFLLCDECGVTEYVFEMKQSRERRRGRSLLVIVYAMRGEFRVCAKVAGKSKAVNGRIPSLQKTNSNCKSGVSVSDGRFVQNFAPHFVLHCMHIIM